jgi:hypothetical protein
MSVSMVQALSSGDLNMINNALAVDHLSPQELTTYDLTATVILEPLGTISDLLCSSKNPTRYRSPCLA